MTIFRKAASAALGIAVATGLGLSAAATADASPKSRQVPGQMMHFTIIKTNQQIHPPHNPRHCTRTYRKVPDGNGGYTYESIRFCL